MTHHDFLREPLDHLEEGLGHPFTLPVPPPYKAPRLRSLPGRLVKQVRLALGGYPTNFVTREQWGALPPKSRSGSITPQTGGVAWHYEGPHMGPFSHDKCAGKVRQIQAFHMGSERGWVDIAYSTLVCPHGFIYEGRGLFIRTAANGTNAGNQAYYAICGLLGVDDPLTFSMVEAYKNCTRWMREAGKAGQKVKSHRYFKPTSCPGDAVAAEAEKWDGKVITAIFNPEPEPTPAPEPAPVPSSEEDPLYIVTDTREDDFQPQYLTNLVTKRWIQTGEEKNEVTQVATAAGFPIKRITLTAATLDAIPTVGEEPTRS